jgi:hypothetical protein
MSQNHDNFDIVRSGFTAQQFVLILVTFLLGMASATVFNDLFVERSFGPASVVAAQNSQESK